VPVVFAPELCEWMKTSVNNASRREFLRGTARWAALSVAALGVGWNLQKRLRLPANCINRGGCGGCTAYLECTLPNALEAKRRSSKGIT